MKDIAQDMAWATALVLWWMLVTWAVSYLSGIPFDRLFLFMLAGTTALEYAKQKRLAT